MTSIATQAAYLLPQLAAPAARALALATVAGFALAAFRVRSAALQLLTWTTILYAALAMPLLAWMLPPLPIPAPAFLRESVSAADTASQLSLHENAHVGTAALGCPVEQSSTCASATVTNRSRFTPAAGSTSQVSPAPQQPTHPKPSPLPWPEILAAVYLASALILLARIFIGLALNRRLLRSSTEINDPRIALRFANYPSPAPHFAESNFVSVPLTLGVLRPRILLPTTWHAWDNAKLDAVITHELSHVARRDALTQRISLLHRAIFCFSPLAWWLDRRLADLAEQASDEAALFGGVDRKQYARILLEFFEALHAAPGRVRWLGVSMAKAGQAEQRVERILSWKGSVAMHLKKSIAVAVVALAVPVVYVAASAFPAHHAAPRVAQLTQDQTPQPPAPAYAPKPDPALALASEATPAAEPTPEPEVAPAPPATSVLRFAPVAGVPYRFAPIAAIRPESPRAPGAPPVAYQSHSSHSSGRGYSYSYGYGDDQRFVIVTGKSDSLTMSGSTEDARHVEKLRKSIAGDFIWFERDEKTYVIRDQATVDRARKLFAPEEELGKKQEALGEQQEVLGKQQEALGAKMEQIQIKVPDMTATLDNLKAKLQKLGSTATMEQISDLQSEIGDLQSKIGEIQSQAGDQQGKLGEQMGVLGEKQGKLGEEQGKLGEQQGRLAEEASHQMKSLLDDSIKNGLAQPEL